MGRFFSASERLHQLLRVPSLVDQDEINQRIINFKNLLEETSESELASTDVNGETVLHLIAKNGCFNELIPELLNRCPQLASISNNRGIYPIHMAIINKNKELLMALLPVSATQQDNKSQNIIHYAVQYWPEVLTLCCNAANSLVREIDEDGFSALDKAKVNKDEVSQRILEDAERGLGNRV